MRKKERKFGDMTFDEIEKWEKETNSIVLFDDEKGIGFQKSKFLDSNEPILLFIIDGVQKPFLVLPEQIKNLKQYLNNNF